MWRALVLISCLNVTAGVRLPRVNAVIRGSDIFPRLRARNSCACCKLLQLQRPPVHFFSSIQVDSHYLSTQFQLLWHPIHQNRLLSLHQSRPVPVWPPDSARQIHPLLRRRPEDRLHFTRTWTRQISPRNRLVGVRRSERVSWLWAASSICSTISRRLG